MNNKEALDTIKQMIADGALKQEAAEKYFPELAESEDDNTKRELLDYLIDSSVAKMIVVTGNDYKRWAAWVEKQGKQKPVEEIKGNNGGISPNSEWSEEDEKLINRVITLIKDGALCKGEKDYFIEKLESLKGRCSKQWKPTGAQIRALEGLIEKCESEWDYDESIGRELLEQLKAMQK